MSFPGFRTHSCTNLLWQHMREEETGGETMIILLICWSHHNLSQSIQSGGVCVAVLMFLSVA